MFRAQMSWPWREAATWSGPSGRSPLWLGGLPSSALGLNPRCSGFRFHVKAAITSGLRKVQPCFSPVPFRSPLLRSVCKTESVETLRVKKRKKEEERETLTVFPIQAESAEGRRGGPRVHDFRLNFYRPMRSGQLNKLWTNAAGFLFVLFRLNHRHFLQSLKTNVSM